jgi:hypothetical protein
MNNIYQHDSKERRKGRLCHFFGLATGENGFTQYASR